MNFIKIGDDRWINFDDVQELSFWKEHGEEVVRIVFSDSGHSPLIFRGETAKAVEEATKKVWDA